MAERSPFQAAMAEAQAQALAEAREALVPREPQEMLSVDEAAAALGVSRRTLYYLFDRDEVKFVQIGGRRKVAQSEVDRVKAGEG